MFRDAPKACFSNFSSFGTPRRFIFAKNDSSGHPETLFFRISIFRDAPKRAFSRFSGFPNVGTSRFCKSENINT